MVTKFMVCFVFQINSQGNGDSENITEDLYEDVDQYQSSGPKEGSSLKSEKSTLQLVGISRRIR